MKIDPKWSQSGPGGRQAVPENQQQYEKLKKKANANTLIRKNASFNVRRFPQKTEGSTAGRLPMFFLVINMLYKTERKGTQPKQQMSQSPSTK